MSILLMFIQELDPSTPSKVKSRGLVLWTTLMGLDDQTLYYPTNAYNVKT